MSEQLTVPFSDFEQQVHDCLTHLYDFMFLQDHPLVEALVPEIKGPNRIQVFREIINNCVESLRPSPELETQPKVSRLYNILRLRYIRQQTVQQVLLNLSLSERQFYRDHPRAIQIVSHMLWEQMTGEAIQEPITRIETEVASVQSEVERARIELTSARVGIRSLLDGALLVTQSLVDQRQVSITNDTSNDISIADSDRTIVRQILITILSQLIACSTRIEIADELVDRYCRITFTINLRQPQFSDLQAISGEQPEHETLRVLVKSIEGEVTSGLIGTHAAHVTLQIPLRQTIVLVIDDNPGMVNLFRRYLTGHPYHIIVTADSHQAIELARRIKPQLIILDVMLPQQDGWEILQNLKNHPTTLNIPVLVCSVLELPDVAVSLGANVYLKKTPSRIEFLRVLEQWSA